MAKRLISLALLICISATAPAQVAQLEAFDNATVQPFGPRGGPNGKAFFNVEGNANGNFASFGAADFNFSGMFNPGLIRVLYVKLDLIADIAGFSQTSGTVEVYGCNDTTTSIQPGPTPPAECYFDVNSLPQGIGNQFGTKWQLGDFQFKGVVGGGIDGDAYSVVAGHLDSSFENYLLNQLNASQTVRILVSPGDADEDGSFAGYSHTLFDGPKLTICATTGTTVAGTVTRYSYDAVDRRIMTLEYRDTGNNVVQTELIPLDLTGGYEARTPDVAGNYTLSIKYSHWLRKNVGPINTSTNNINIDFGLINGDVDDDNEITIVDYAAVATAFGSVPGDSNWNVDADLNGDDEVNIVDIGIVATNFGLAGDE